MSRNWAAYAKSTYQWQPGHEKMLRITKTSLTSDFDFCPKQYQYKRIHQLPEPSTDAMTKGTNVHDAVEEFYDNAMPIVEELFKLMQRDKREEALALALSILPEKEYTLGEQPVIETRIKWDLERLLSVGPDKYLPIMNELEVHAFVDEEFEFNGEMVPIPIHYAGSIDRGFSEEDGGVAIMELKTGKWVQSKNKDDEWNDSKFKMQSMRTEMAYYQYLLAKAEHQYQNVTHWGWVYPAGSGAQLDTYNKYGYEQRAVDRIVYEALNTRTVNTYRKKIEKLKAALLTAYLTDDFPAKPSTAKCAWCSFKSICPSWDGNDNPQEYLDEYGSDNDE
jgi:CRISPR/Cas system-associated exonuclease Cas4 (RecB family)